MQNLLAQLPLNLNLRNEATFDNFYPGRNEEIILELKKTASGRGETVIYLCGARGEGCSHLLQACCHEAHLQQLRSIYLPLNELVSLSSEILNGIEAVSLVCIDDLQVIRHYPEWEEAIFHLYNRVYDAGGRIIIAADNLPKAIHLNLSDLVSRLSWGIVYQLQALGDEEKLTVLTLRANRRGMNLPKEVGKYILTHCPRELGKLFAALEDLDKASLAAQRRLTIPFVKKVLAKELLPPTSKTSEFLEDKS